MSLADAIALVEPGQCVSFGGFNLQNKPMAAVRELVRGNIAELTVICAAPSSLDIDFVVGAGLVRELVAQSVSAEDLAAIAPSFRRACEAGTLDVIDVDQGVVNAGLRAAKMGIESIIALGATGTSSAAHGGRWLTPGVEPFTRRSLTYVRQMRPDVAFVHVTVADTQGRGRQVGSVFNDALLCGAARQVIVTAERVVSPDELRTVDGTPVTWRDNTVAVVEAPNGAHPAASGGSYSYDAPAIERYRDRVWSGDGFTAYRDDVIGPSEASYQQQVGIGVKLS
jgi:glutaconate CoA-transferase subunit A